MDKPKLSTDVAAAAVFRVGHDEFGLTSTDRDATNGKGLRNKAHRRHEFAIAVLDHREVIGREIRMAVEKIPGELADTSVYGAIGPPKVLEVKGRETLGVPASGSTDSRLRRDHGPTSCMSGRVLCPLGVVS
jgi:hypothetical protein